MDIGLRFKKWSAGTMEINRCMNCMSELKNEESVCPVCGFDNRKIEQPPFALRCNSILHGRYLIGKVLGKGGFGITYIGMDLMLEVKVAVKEYFPTGEATRDQGGSSALRWEYSQDSMTMRRKGYDSFLKEARKMAKLDQIPTIVRVRDIFLENATAYIVMDYVEGTTLKEKLQKYGTMTFSECMDLLRPMMKDLAKVHKQGMIHRDISPDNIMVQKDDSVRLLDLGAAKDMTAVQGPKSQMVTKKGFSPLEQYMDAGKIGPWTDVYALCATLYYCITGKVLPAAIDRIDQPKLRLPDTMKESLPQTVKDALKAGLSLKAAERIQSVEELLDRLEVGKDPLESDDWGWGLPLASISDFDYTKRMNGGGINVNKYHGIRTELQIPEEIEGAPVIMIGNEAFLESEVEKVGLPRKAAFIGEKAFYHCRRLNFIGLPEELLDIGTAAFEGCVSLTEIHFPDDMFLIDRWAFAGTMLSSVCIPTSVGIIGMGAFALHQNARLERFEFREGNPGDPEFDDDSYYENDGVLYRKYHNINTIELWSYPQGRRGSFTIPEGVKRIRGYAFANCVGLTALDVPSSVLGIGENAFLNCKQLVRIFVPRGCTVDEQGENSPEILYY